MDNDDTTEAGVLSVFRLFTGLQFGVLAISALAFARGGSPSPHSVEAVTLMTGLTGALLIFLLWAQPRRLLGRAYVPAAVLVAWLTPLAGQSLTLGKSFGEHVGLATETSAFLLVPLLVVSWKYGFRIVTLFSFATALIDLGVVALAFEPADWLRSAYVRLVCMRTIGFLGVGYIVSRLVREQREKQRLLAEANAELAQHAATREQLAASRERNRLARELHDTLAHTLSGVTVQLEAVRSLWDVEPANARSMLERSLSAARCGLGETRRALKALRAAPLEDLGLVLAIRNLAEPIAARSGWALELKLPAGAVVASTEVEQCFYRVAQEALTNAAKHADARRVSVVMTYREPALTLSISDDGTGYVAEDVDDRQHFGLRGMREWAETIGGGVEVTSYPGRGTVVTLEHLGGARPDSPP